MSTHAVTGIMQQPSPATGKEHFLFCATCPEPTPKFADTPASSEKEPESNSAATSDTILFAYDSDILDGAARARLQALTARITKGSTIDITGYTDAAGGRKYNEHLALRRAESVHQFFHSHINYRVTYAMHARGKCCYVRNPGLNPENRRVEVHIKGGSKP